MTGAVVITARWRKPAAGGLHRRALGRRWRCCRCWKSRLPDPAALLAALARLLAALLCAGGLRLAQRHRRRVRAHHTGRPASAGRAGRGRAALAAHGHA
jgi:hypothetical protein